MAHAKRVNPASDRKLGYQNYRSASSLTCGFNGNPTRQTNERKEKKKGRNKIGRIRKTKTTKKTSAAQEWTSDAPPRALPEQQPADQLLGARRDADVEGEVHRADLVHGLLGSTTRLDRAMDWMGRLDGMVDRMGHGLDRLDGAWVWVMDHWMFLCGGVD